MLKNLFVPTVALVLAAAVAAAMCTGCSGKKPRAKLGSAGQEGAAQPGPSRATPPEYAEKIAEFAEMERSGGFAPGLGLAESNFREGAGDYPGAVLAVFKELAWAYSGGQGGVTREALVRGLEEVRGKNPGPGAAEAAEAALLFFAEDWSGARAKLAALPPETASEPDSFRFYLATACALEDGGGTLAERSAYSALRSRYASFPEYWYRGARAFARAGGSPQLSPAGAFAERCINIAPAGPYAAECRGILAQKAGLSGNDGGAIRTQAEIERLVKTALESGKPETLADLLPLIGLPDNPYTLYASGALRALAADEKFRLWFSGEAAKSKGRLAERLSYIARG
jgi:hypothetical protein